MGVSINAYTNLKLTRRKTFLKDNTLYIEGNVFWPERHLPFKDQRYYSYEDNHHVIDCGYGRFHGFRNKLARFAGYKYNIGERGLSEDDLAYAEEFPYAFDALKKNSGLFNIFLSFTDCGGVIGYLDCIKLLKDFEDNKEYAMIYASTTYDNSFKETYLEMVEGLKFASQKGALVID